MVSDILLLIQSLLHLQKGASSSSDSSGDDADGRYDDHEERFNDEAGTMEQVPLGVSNEQTKQVK